MHTQKTKTNILIPLILVLLAVFGVYWFTFSSKGQSSDTYESNPTSIDEKPRTEKDLSLVLEEKDANLIADKDVSNLDQRERKPEEEKPIVDWAQKKTIIDGVQKKPFVDRAHKKRIDENHRFATAAPITEKTTQTPETPTVHFFVQVITAEMVEKQILNIRHFFQENFRYHLVDGSSVESQSLELKAIADTYKLDYHRCPEKSLARCMNFVSINLAPSIQNGYLVHMNVDMFLLRPWSISAYFTEHGNPDIMAVIEDHVFNGRIPLPTYLHPNLLMLNMKSLYPIVHEMLFDLEPNRDLGSKTRAFMDKYPHLKLKPSMWSRHFDVTSLYQVGKISYETMKLMQKEQELRGPLAADLYTSDFCWYHLRDSTCWSKKCPQKFSETYVWPVIQPLLLDSTKHQFEKLSIDDSQWRNLNLFHEGSSTSGNAMNNGHGKVDQNGFLLEFPPSGCWSDSESERSQCFTRKSISLKKKRVINYGFNSEHWMRQLYHKVELTKQKIKHKIAHIQQTGVVPLPNRNPRERTNLHLKPIRYSIPHFQRDTSYYWRYVYNGSQDLQQPEALCTKKPGQKYWALSFAIGETRIGIANQHTRPTCLQHGVDEFILLTDADFDDEFRERNAETLSNPKGVGMWIWKHWGQYKVMEKMNDGDILFYVDSDFRCTNEVLQYFCLAQHQDVTAFHHSNSDYTLARLASRDSMILMDMDEPEVATSVQMSGGNIFFKKSPSTIEFIKELSAYSQQHEVVCCFGKSSQFGEDWPKYKKEKFHQCDQAISSLLVVKYGFKTFPWHLEGYGAGSDDDLNRAQRREAGLTDTAVTIHVRNDGEISWPPNYYPRV